MYQLYTLPNCEKCHKAVDTFKERGIKYQEISLTSGNGLKKIKELTKTYRDRISRERGSLVLPLITVENNGCMQIYQGEEGLAKLLSETA